jgi:hypothetical protein
VKRHIPGDYPKTLCGRSERSVICISHEGEIGAARDICKSCAITVADGVTVRVVRDTTGGNFNVCYVASRTLDKTPASTSPAAIAVSISCVSERKP